MNFNHECLTYEVYLQIYMFDRFIVNAYIVSVFVK